MLREAGRRVGREVGREVEKAAWWTWGWHPRTHGAYPDSFWHRSMLGLCPHSGHVQLQRDPVPSKFCAQVYCCE